MWVRMWEKKEALHTLGGNVNWYRFCGKHYKVFSKN